MIKKYNVTVNGITYEVEVEEVKGEFQPRSVAAPVVSAPAPQAPAAQPVKAEPKEEKPVAPAPNIATEGEKIECPMPGTIIKVSVSEGQEVKKGEVLFVLEAMKMENEIMSPRDGKIVQVGVAKGATANTGDLLAVIQ